MLTDANWSPADLMRALVGDPTVVPIAAPIIDPRTMRMIENAIRSSRFVVLVGPPGTGKGTVLSHIVSLVAQDPVKYGFAPHTPGWPDPIKRTPDDSWTSFDLLGGLAPTARGLEFRPGTLLEAIEHDRWLILDELNRGELDKIFGSMLTWLAMEDVDVQAPSGDQPGVRLTWSSDEAKSARVAAANAGGDVEYRAGADWRLLGTFNPQDAQRVFGIGQALGRRFRQIPIPPIDAEQFLELLGSQCSGLESHELTALDRIYQAHQANAKFRLGPALFIEMARYLLAAKAVTTDPAPTPRESLAEAYVISIGRHMANHSASDREELGRTGEFTAAFGEEWAWVTSQIQLMA